MKSSITLLGSSAVMAVLVLSGGAALAEEPLTNADILELVSAGLPSTVIVAKIQASEAAFDTSVDELIALSREGVDASVLEAMARSADRAARTAGAAAAVTVRSGASSAPNSQTNFDGTPCDSPGIFHEADDGSLAPVDATTLQTKEGSGLLQILSYGLIPLRISAIAPGAQANLRMDDPHPRFWFCFEESEGGLSYPATGALNPSDFLLVRLDVNERRRERSFRIGSFRLWTGNRQGTPPSQLVEVTYEQLNPGVYEVSPVAPLGPDEYGFYYTGQQGVAMAGPGTGGGVFTGGGVAVGSSWPGWPGWIGAAGRIFAFGVDAP